MSTELIPQSLRKQVYVYYALTGIVLGAIQVGFGAAQAGQPLALTVALAVYAFLGGAFGFVARVNINQPAGTNDGLVLTPDEQLLIRDARALEGRDGP